MVLVRLDSFCNVALCHWVNGSYRWWCYGPWKCWQPCMQHSVTFQKMLTESQLCQKQTLGTYCTLRALQILHLNSSDVVFMQWQSGVVTLCPWKHYRRWYTRVVQSQRMSKFVHCCVQQIPTWNTHPIIVHLIWNSINNSLPTGQVATHISILVPCPHEPHQIWHSRGTSPALYYAPCWFNPQITDKLQSVILKHCISTMYLLQSQNWNQLCRLLLRPRNYL